MSAWPAVWGGGFGGGKGRGEGRDDLVGNRGEGRDDLSDYLKWLSEIVKEEEEEEKAQEKEGKELCVPVDLLLNFSQFW